LAIFYNFVIKIPFLSKDYGLKQGRKKSEKTLFENIISVIHWLFHSFAKITNGLCSNNHCSKFNHCEYNLDQRQCLFGVIYHRSTQCNILSFSQGDQRVS